MRICLITPGHLSTDPRLVKEADALFEAGHEVTVVSASYQDWSKDTDRAFDTRPWVRVPPIAFGPKAPRPLRLKQVVRQKSARVLASMGLRQARILGAAFHPATPELTRAAIRISADLYIAHCLAALPSAAEAARRIGARYAFDAEDFHSGEFADGVRSLDTILVGEIERKWLGGCEWMTAASPGIADAYVEAYGLARPTVVLNVFPQAEAPASPTPIGDFQPPPSIYWFSQTIGPDRGLETAIRAIKVSSTQPSLVLRGQPSQGYDVELRRLAEIEGVADKLHILPPDAPARMLQAAAVHDLGLCAEVGHTRNRRIALTNKLFTFLQAGVPTLLSDIESHRAIAQDLDDTVVLFRSGDAQSLASAIDAFLLDPARLAEARAHAFRLGRDRFSWDVEKAKIIDLVDGLCGGRPGS